MNYVHTMNHHEQAKKKINANTKHLMELHGGSCRAPRISLVKTHGARHELHI